MDQYKIDESTALSQAKERVQGMAAVPAIRALLGALFQIARDSAEFEKHKYLQQDQQIFSLGASSHMSTVAFDKHIAFCESYMAEVHEIVGILFREGPTEQAMACAQRLFALKRDYAAWIPKSIALRLEPFENALHNIGVQTHLVAALRSDQHQASSRAIDESYALFTNVLSLEKNEGNRPRSQEGDRDGERKRGST